MGWEQDPLLRDTKARLNITVSQCVLRERYQLLKHIGHGSFGSVYLARRRDADRASNFVAIKCIKKPIEEAEHCLQLREVQCLYTLPRHPAIVSVLECFHDPKTKFFQMVMETMEQNLYQLIKSRDSRYFELRTIKHIFTQILEALKHCHDNNFFHRDIKPENVLVSTVSTGHPPSRPSAASPGCLEAFQHNPYTLSPPPTPVRYVVKLADFGLAREITCDAPYTSYVSTRWYRAPEIILRADKYHAPVDMWAFGAMAAEIVALAPLFPGKDEIDQIQRICGVLGTPEDWRNSHNEIVGGGPWADGDKLTTRLNLVFKPTPPVSLETFIGSSWPSSLSFFIQEHLLWDPDSRLTASQALQHEFLYTSNIPIYSRTRIRPRTPRTSPLYYDPKIQDASKHTGQLNYSSSPRLAITNLSSSDRSFPTTKDSLLEMDKDRRQSWFARKKDQLIGCHQSIVPWEPATTIQETGDLSQEMRNEGRTALRAQDRPPYNKRIPMPYVPPTHPLSPLSNTTPIHAHDVSISVPIHDHYPSKRGSAVDAIQILKCKEAVRNLDQSSSVPITQFKRVIRSVSNLSLDSNPALNSNAAQYGSPPRRATLFCHTRKKHKLADQENAGPAIHSSSRYFKSGPPKLYKSPRLPEVLMQAHSEAARVRSQSSSVTQTSNPASTTQITVSGGATERPFSASDNNESNDYVVAARSVRPSYSQGIREGDHKLHTPHSPMYTSSYITTTHDDLKVYASSRAEPAANVSRPGHLERSAATPAVLRLTTTRQTPQSQQRYNSQSLPCSIPSYAKSTEASSRRSNQHVTSQATPRSKRKKMPWYFPSPPLDGVASITNLRNTVVPDFSL